MTVIDIFENIQKSHILFYQRQCNKGLVLQRKEQTYQLATTILYATVRVYGYHVRRKVKGWAFPIMVISLSSVLDDPCLLVCRPPCGSFHQ